MMTEQLTLLIFAKVILENINLHITQQKQHLDTGFECITHQYLNDFCI